MSSTDIDRLSSLPTEIRSHILSLMPTEYSIRTSTLSKSWRYSWKLVTNLDFDCAYTTDSWRFTSFVDRVLSLRIPSPVNLFRLCIYISLPSHTKSNWINEAVRLNVRELYIHVSELELPLSLFTCKTLTKLRLYRYCFDKRVWGCPCPVNLPCLKTLDIAIYENPFRLAFKLISGSPMLESLSLEVVSHNTEEDYIFNIPTLKRLILRLVDRSVINKVVLNVPNLVYLCIDETLCSLFVMEDVSSLVEASISFSHVTYDHLWLHLLKGLRGVESFSIVLFQPTLFMSLSSYETHYQLSEFWHSGRILQVLENFPALKHLYIDRNAVHRWTELTPVMNCMLSKLTAIKLPKEKWDREFLDCVKTLTTITMKRFCAQLLKLPSASKNREIHFHGKSQFFY